MKKLITAMVASLLMSCFALEAWADEFSAPLVPSVDVIALSQEQVSELRREKAIYQAYVEMLTSMDDRMAEQELQAIRREFERRFEAIVNAGQDS